MCGIAGVVSFDAPPDPGHLSQMTSALAHRGPDDEGVHLEGPCGLGFRRLSVIDLAGGHQPMTASGATVVFNGEVYNFRELRRELEARGHAFRTNSDTEALLQAYLCWGEGFVSRLDGMFAFAVWDAPRRKLVAARDRFGKKPFYFAQVGRALLFASELKSLLRHPGCPREIDPRAVRRYLAFDYVPGPDCIFGKVSKLPAAHRLVWEEKGLRVAPYWRFPPAACGHGWPSRAADGAAENLRELLRAAVRKRLVSDVPLGVFLSGGIDSSAITAMAAAETPRLETFTISFEESSGADRGYDESRHARLAARAFGTEHFEERLSRERCLALVPGLADQLDEPFADQSFLPTYLLSRFARGRVTVALGGDGADELFGGYDTFLAHPLGMALGTMPNVLKSALERAASRLPHRAGYMSFDYRLRTLLSGARFADRYRHQAWIGSFTPERADQALAPDWRATDPVADAYGPIDDFDGRCGERGMEWALRYYLSLYLPDDILVKVDRASMAVSLEVRAPFLDTALAEFVLGLPLRFKVRGLTRKWLLKRALRGLVPDQLIFRKKHGFAFPVAAWLRGPLRPLMLDLLAEGSLRRAGIFEPGEIRRLVSEHLSGETDHRKPLWALMMFELWRRRWAGGE
ncbi:MAG: asparagine synthase (glutamine-hydrolyzing) [Myxococcales bacterium]|nr:asparagine synthase (glutamine-hydrolyzing) [Myxococcales bacterium]